MIGDVILMVRVPEMADVRMVVWILVMMAHYSLSMWCPRGAVIAQCVYFRRFAQTIRCGVS